MKALGKKPPYLIEKGMFKVVSNVELNNHYRSVILETINWLERLDKDVDPIVIDYQDIDELIKKLKVSVGEDE